MNDYCGCCGFLKKHILEELTKAEWTTESNIEGWSYSTKYRRFNDHLQWEYDVPNIFVSFKPIKFCENCGSELSPESFNTDFVLGQKHSGKKIGYSCKKCGVVMKWK